MRVALSNRALAATGAAVLLANLRSQEPASDDAISGAFLRD